MACASGSVAFFLLAGLATVAFVVVALAVTALGRASRMGLAGVVEVKLELLIGVVPS